MKKGILSLLFIIMVLISSGQKTSNFNPDTLIKISKIMFDKYVDTSIALLQTKKLSEISDSGHIKIMMCLNTIFMAHDSTFQSRFRGGRYQKLEQLAEEKRYKTDIKEVYTEWIPNRGMGYYFPKLKMEMDGSPRLYAWFQVYD